MSGRRLYSLMMLFLGGLACDAARPVKSAPPSALVTCTRCHGDAGRGNAAPPRSTTGAIATTDPSVGAHQSHLVAGHFRSPIACQECHQVPATVDEAGHMAGIPATVRFDAPGSNGLARAGGAAARVDFGAASGSAGPARRDLHGLLPRRDARRGQAHPAGLGGELTIPPARRSIARAATGSLPAAATAELRADARSARPGLCALPLAHGRRGRHAGPRRAESTSMESWTSRAATRAPPVTETGPGSASPEATPWSQPRRRPARPAPRRVRTSPT